jgi:hypothetical protein
MYDLNDPLLEFQRSESFPKDYALGGSLGSGPLVPIQLTYPVLTKVINLSFDMVANGKGKMGQGLVYMTKNCINKKSAHVHMASAANWCLFERAKRNEERNTVCADHVITDQLQNPIRYLPLSIPSLYARGIPLHAFTATPNAFDTTWCWKDGLLLDHDIGRQEEEVKKISSLSQRRWSSLIPSLIHPSLFADASQSQS